MKTGNGKLIRIKGKVNTPMYPALDLTLEFDRADLLPGNLLLVNAKRYFIVQRKPPDPAPGQTPTVTLREDTMTRGQRRNARHQGRLRGK